jgi:DNA-binding response OmpR family regulator
MTDNTKKILIIDDDEQDRAILIRFLIKGGYTDIIIARDGEEGLKQARDCKPDMIICDIDMPKKDGFAVLKQIRRDRVLHRIPFIMLTGLDDFRKVKKAYEYEADFYIEKSSNYALLVKNIQVLFNLAKRKLT